MACENFLTKSCVNLPIIAASFSLPIIAIVLYCHYALLNANWEHLPSGTGPRVRLKPVFNQTGAMLAVSSSCEGSASALLAVISPVRQNWERMYLLNSSSESESSDSGIICGLSSAREPPNMNVVAVFWVVCGNCGDWFHTACALGDNSCSCQYFCMNCA